MYKISKQCTTTNLQMSSVSVRVGRILSVKVNSKAARRINCWIIMSIICRCHMEVLPMSTGLSVLLALFNAHFYPYFSREKVWGTSDHYHHAAEKCSLANVATCSDATAQHWWWLLKRGWEMLSFPSEAFVRQVLCFLLFASLYYLLVLQ